MKGERKERRDSNSGMKGYTYVCKKERQRKTDQMERERGG